jgi:hypothetical protein
MEVRVKKEEKKFINCQATVKKNWFGAHRRS